MNDDRPSPTAAGWIAFAGIIMIIAGAFQMFSGLVALVDDEFYVTTPEYVLQLDTTAWGWIHMLIGLVLVASGIGVYSGNVLARTVGVFVAAASMLSVFLWLPWYPFWGFVVLFVDISVIWALTVHGRDYSKL
jgi:hypothetical protein